MLARDHQVAAVFPYPSTVSWVQPLILFAVCLQAVLQWHGSTC